MTLKVIKNTSFVLVALATLLIVLRIINFKKIAVAAAEAGLWDILPQHLRKALFLAYPVLLLSSFVLFMVSKKEKTRVDFMIPVLFLLNGLVLLFLLVVYLTVLIRNL
jgi:hypothetical protein